MVVIFIFKYPCLCTCAGQCFPFYQWRNICNRTVAIGSADENLKVWISTNCNRTDDSSCNTISRSIMQNDKTVKKRGQSRFLGYVDFIYTEFIVCLISLVPGCNQTLRSCGPPRWTMLHREVYMFRIPKTFYLREVAGKCAITNLF